MTLPVRCPTCEAPPQRPCIASGAEVVPDGLHAERRLLAQLARACPSCGASPGAPCITLLSERPLLDPHPERAAPPTAAPLPAMPAAPDPAPPALTAART